MATQFPACEVRIWGQTVGYLADTGNGIVNFEYADSFIPSGLEISPIKLPLAAGRIYTNTDDPLAFEGLPGVFSDALPDAYGKQVVRKYFADKYPGRDRFISPVEQLTYIGSRAIGALEFVPAENVGPVAREALEVSYLVEQARKVLRGDISMSIASIMQSYATAGGQRPKAVIAWNRKTDEIRAGIPPVPDGFENWIMKFDGADGTPKEFGRIEHAYALMAADAGIAVPTTCLIEENGRAHFLTRRFDNNDGTRLHMHSFGGLIHADYNKPQLVDYTDFLAATMLLTKAHSEVEQAFRRMVFNVLARNQDDHVKNFAFLMDRDGQWKLSPAFDLTYANGGGWTSRHQMTIAGEASSPTDRHMLQVADDHGIKHARDIIEQVREVVARWPEFAEQAGLSAEWTERISEDLRVDIIGNHMRP